MRQIITNWINYKNKTGQNLNNLNTLKQIK